MPSLRARLNVPLRGQSTASIYPALEGENDDGSSDVDDLDAFQLDAGGLSKDSAALHKDRFGRRLAKRNADGVKPAAQVKAELEAKMSETVASMRRQSKRSLPEVRTRSSGRSKRKASPRRDVDSSSPRSSRTPRTPRATRDTVNRNVDASAPDIATRSPSRENWCRVEGRSHPRVLALVPACSSVSLSLSDKSSAFVQSFYPVWDGLSDTCERILAQERNGSQAKDEDGASAPPSFKRGARTSISVA